YLNCLMYTSRL
ncbi:putative membrane protein, partial [Vibrio cholerae HC-02C1]